MHYRRPGPLQFFWGAHTFLACFARILASPENLAGGGGGVYSSIGIGVHAPKIPDNIFWQASKKKKKKKKVARIFAWIIPEFCPNFVRFLPEFLHWQFFFFGPPSPVSYAYALIIQVVPIVNIIMLQCLRLYFKTLNQICLISKCMIVLFSVNQGCYQLCLSFLEIKNRRNVELSPSNNDIEQNTFTCWSTQAEWLWS